MLERAKGRHARTVAGVAIAAYLAPHALFLLLNVLGDAHRHPVAYFYTWDMFPGSHDQSTRRIVLGQTRNGGHVQLFPNASQRFRGGVKGDMTRADLDRAGLRSRELAENSLARAAPLLRDDPIVEAVLLEQFWPSRLNLEPDLYEPWAGEPHRSVHYWRIREKLAPGE